VKQSQIFSLLGLREVIPFTPTRYLVSAQGTSLTSPAGYHSPQGCGVSLYALSNSSVIRGSGGVGMGRFSELLNLSVSQPMISTIRTAGKNFS